MSFVMVFPLGLTDWHSSHGVGEVVCAQQPHSIDRGGKLAMLGRHGEAIHSAVGKILVWACVSSLGRRERLPDINDKSTGQIVPEYIVVNCCSVLRKDQQSRCASCQRITEAQNRIIDRRS